MWEKSGDSKSSSMDPYTNDEGTFTTLFKAHVNLFTQSSLTFKRTLRLDGCVVVTIDDNEVIIVNISDTIEGENLTPTFHKLCTHKDCGSGGLDIQTSSLKGSGDITSPSNTPRQDSSNDQNTLSRSSDSVQLFLMPSPRPLDHASDGPNTEAQTETAALDQSADTRLLASAASNDQIESYEVGTTKSSLCLSPSELEESIRSVAPDQESSPGTRVGQSHGRKTACENTPPQTCLALNNNMYKRKPMKRILVCPSKASSKAGLVNDSSAVDVMNNRLCADRRSVNGNRRLSTDGITKCKRRKKKTGLEHTSYDDRSRHDGRLNGENAEKTPPNVICASDDNCEFVNHTVDLRRDVVHTISNRLSCKGEDAGDASLRDSPNIRPVCLSAKSSTIHFQSAGISRPLKTLTRVSQTTCSSSVDCENSAEPWTASCTEVTQLSPPSGMGSDNTALLTPVVGENATTPPNTENYIYTRAGRIYATSTSNEITTVTPTPDKSETLVPLSSPLNSASTVNPGPTSSVNVGSSLSSVQLASTASSCSRSMADDTETTSVSQSDSNHAPPFLTPHEKICTELSRKIGDLDAKSDRLMKVLNKNKLDRENRSSLKRDFIKCMNAYSDAKESFISLKSLLLVPEKSNYSLLWLNDIETLERRIMKDLNTASDKLQRINEIYYKIVYNISPSVVKLQPLDKCVEYS